MDTKFKYDVFLSHSSADLELVRDIAARLDKDGLKVWFDETNHDFGDHNHNIINENIPKSKKVVVCWSEHAAKSEWIDAELSAALDKHPKNKGRRLGILLFDDAVLPAIVKDLNHIDWRQQGDKKYANLLRFCRERPQNQKRGMGQSLTEPHIPTGTLGLHDKPVIGIVGMGFAGTTTAIRVMQLVSCPIRLILFEHKMEQQFGGLAYGTSSLKKHHYLNIHAGRISIYRERPEDFLKWATEDAVKSEWRKVLGMSKSQWARSKSQFLFNEFSAVPRLIYQLYLRDRYKSAKKHSRGLVGKPEIIKGHVFDIKVEEYPSRTRLHYTDEKGRKKYKDVDIAVLCTGHQRPKLPEFAIKHPAFFEEPYNPDYEKRISKGRSRKTERLLVLGTGLSSYDAAISAIAAGFKGAITMCSHNRFKHGTYPQDHSHIILPRVFKDLFKDVFTAEGMTDALKQALEIATNDLFPRYFPEADPNVIPERVLKAIEPDMKEFVERANQTEVKSFLRQWSWITTMRTSVVAEVPDQIKGTQVSIERETVTNFRPISNGRLAVTFSDKSVQNFDIVVCCLGYDPVYEPSHLIGLWKKIMEEYAVPHEKTGLGIEVGNNGRVLIRSREGSPSQSLSRSLYAVGTMRQGDEIQQRGRLGAFTFSIGTIRNQSLLAALSILQRLELPAWRFSNVAEKGEYRDKIDKLVEQLRSATPKFDRLVTRLSDIQFLPKTSGKDACLEELKKQIQQLVPIPGQIDLELLKYHLWHRARIIAGGLVTDIKRQSERYSLIRLYRPGASSMCMNEKKDCKEIVQRLMHHLRAESATLSLYLDEPEQMGCLYPFVDHLRIDVLTPTPYGKHTAGLLIKAYLENVSKNALLSGDGFFKPSDKVKPYYENGNVLGIAIPDYNQVSSKKPAFEVWPRTYPNLLVTLIVKNKKLLGVIYLEAALERKFEETEVREVLKTIGQLPELLSRAATIWVHRRDTDRENQRLDFLVEKGKSMRNMNLTNASLKNAILSPDVDLSFSILNGAICNGATFDMSSLRKTKMVGTNFTSASLRGSDLSGSSVFGADFTGVHCEDALITGATIERTSFRNAIMDRSLIAGTRLHRVDFTGASMKGAKLIQVRIEDGCIFSLVDWNGCCIGRETFESLPGEVKSRCGRDVQILNL